MSMTVQFRCHGCGATVDAAREPPFRCPHAERGDDVDHVLAAESAEAAFCSSAELNPFLRYRALLSPYRLARSSGLSDAAWSDIVEALDAALVAVDGRGFRMTPMVQQQALAAALNSSSSLWVKDETGNVAGSHKARHLAGVLLYLRVLEAAKLPAGAGLRARRLAIASCGNAALAAAVLANAADWPLDVFIPVGASPAVQRALRELGARVVVCERNPDSAGDPCVARFREAVAGGAVPFSVQGGENGLAVEGGRTLGFEMAEAFSATGTVPDLLFVQVGGGALASAMAQALDIAARLRVVATVPRLIAVQTASCAPLARSWDRLAGHDLADAARHRSRYMWPWETPGTSLADGILDDETYDWWAVTAGMRASGGRPIIATEDTIARAWRLAHLHTGIRASATGTAGLAGAISAADPGRSVAVVFSGVERK
jgi:threonine synthase